MAADQKIYPVGRIAMSTGDLFDVVDVKVDQKNNAKQQHTLRRSGNGIFKGPEETTVSFNATVSEDGPEHDYLRDLKRGRIRELRIKIPGETLTVKGMASSRSLEFSTDDAIKYSIEFVGHTED